MPFPDGSLLGGRLLHDAPPRAGGRDAGRQALRLGSGGRRRPGGEFGGTHSVGGGFAFKLAHRFGDLYVPLDPATLGARLEDAGFERVSIDQGTGGRRLDVLLLGARPGSG